MFNFCGYCSNELVDGVCPECGRQFRTASDLAKDVVEVLMERQEACNVFILAAAKALEAQTDDAEVIITATTEFIAELSMVDETVMDLLDYINQVELEEEYSICDECFCQGCPYADECDGDCFFDDEDFFSEDDQETGSEDTNSEDGSEKTE